MIKSKNFILPKKSAFTIDTADDFIKLHSVAVISGKRGAGKTLALVNLLRKARDRNYFDRIFVITPTYNSNKTLWDIAYINEEDAFMPEKDSIKNILKLVQADKDEWEAHLYKLEMYKKYHKDKHKSHYSIDDEDMLFYAENEFFEKKPEWKYHKDGVADHPPRISIILDDCLSLPVMSRPSSGLVNLCISSRHVCDGLGVSVFLLVQSYKCQGGVPRVIREQTLLLCLFKMCDMNQVDAIEKEIGSDVGIERFREFLEYATREPHGFLTINFAPKKGHSMFMRNFEEELR
jgi:hypothetical protein